MSKVKDGRVKVKGVRVAEGDTVALTVIGVASQFGDGAYVVTTADGSEFDVADYELDDPAVSVARLDA